MKNRFFSILFSSFICAVMAGCAAVQPTQTTTSLQAIDLVDTERYLGSWFEIARYENWFEKGCAAATAEYSKKNDYIQVINRCFEASGREIDVAKGRLYPAGEPRDGRFKVTFFRPFYGHYWIIMLADDYRYAVVGHPDRTYLWILARTRQLAEADRETILARLPELGYDPEKLLWGYNNVFQQR